jgi:AcrR family transcriptional regulator
MGRWQPDARSRLQEAAVTLYTERGYDQTTVAEIAERAGLTKRTFFRHFADKREVLFRGAEVLQEEMVAAIDAVPGPAAPLDLIAAALDAAGTRFEEVREFAAVRNAIIASSSELRERELIKAATLVAAMADALRARGLDPTEAALTAHACLAVFHVAFGQWISAPEGPPYSQVARAALARLRDITGAGQAAPS